MDYDWTALILELGINVLITAFVYLLVPCIILLTGKKYKAKTIKRISIVYCILCWFLFRIVQIESGIEPRSGASVILWGGVGYWMMKKRCLKEDSGAEPDQTEPYVSEQPTDTADNEVHPTYSLSDPNEIPQKSTVGWNISGQDVMYVEADAMPEVPISTAKRPVAPATPAQSPSPEQKVKVRYCSKCGSTIDNQTKKCTGCGKQYFKGIPWKLVCNIAVVVLLVASFAGNVILYNENSELGDTIVELEGKISTLRTRVEQLTEKNTQWRNLNASLESDLESVESVVAFYDAVVVFVEDDGTRFYHSYYCDKFVGDYYWAYNVELAEYKGYKPCPLCCSEESSDKDDDFASEYWQALLDELQNQ